MRRNGQRVIHEDVDFCLNVHKNVVEQATYISFYIRFNIKK